MKALSSNRLALIAYLAKHAPTHKAAPNQWIGRTALMKLCYFLQELKQVKLGYRFTLYSYGPFDPAVLGDLGIAESLGLVEVGLQEYPSGYGYKIESRIDDEKIEQVGGDLYRDHKGDLDWVLETFGSKSAGELEVESTIVFVDRSYESDGERVSLDALARCVHDVKPHLKLEMIKEHVQTLLEQGLLKSVAAPAPS